MAECERGRKIFYRAIERSIEFFFTTIATSLPEEAQEEIPFRKEAVSSSSSPTPPEEEMLQPTDIERYKAQKILERMGWKIPSK